MIGRGNKDFRFSRRGNVKMDVFREGLVGRRELSPDILVLNTGGVRDDSEGLGWVSSGLWVTDRRLLLLLLSTDFLPHVKTERESLSDNMTLSEPRDRTEP